MGVRLCGKTQESTQPTFRPLQLSSKKENGMIPPLLRKNTEQRAPLKKSDVCVFGGYPGEGSKRDLRNSGPTKRPSLAVEVALRPTKRPSLAVEVALRARYRVDQAGRGVYI